MKSNEPKLKGFEKARHYLESLLDPESFLVLPTGERIKTSSETLQKDISDYMGNETSKLDHLVAIDKESVPTIVLIPIVEAG